MNIKRQTATLIAILMCPPPPGIWIQIDFFHESMQMLFSLNSGILSRNKYTSNEKESKTLMLVQNSNAAEETIEGWFTDTVIDLSTSPWPWDYTIVEGSPFPLKSEITYRTFKINRDISCACVEVLDDKQIENHPEKEFMKNFIPPIHYRFSGDFTVFHGDGGSTPMYFPVYFRKNLGISDNTRERLFLELENLNLQRKDYQLNGVVEDIIDPDLFPYRRPFADWKQDKIVAHSRSVDRKHAISSSNVTSKKHYEKQLEDITLTEITTVRNSYSWLPAEFYIQENLKVVLKSPIHNLPYTKENKSLYTCIVKVFQAMLPMFASLRVFKPGIPTTLQVVVKAQTYRLRPGVSYAGKWHTEGYNENIVAGGVYYCHISPGLEGGNLKFRPQIVPQVEVLKDINIPIEEGSAVVFSNTIPHRFRKIQNTATNGTTQIRTFLSFFIIDPTVPIVSTRNFPTIEFLVPILEEYIENFIKIKFPRELTMKILSFIPSLFPSEEEAYLFRKKSRECMSKSKFGWGWIHWGNVGETFLCENYEELLPKFYTGAYQENELQNTDSQ